MLFKVLYRNSTYNFSSLVWSQPVLTAGSSQPAPEQCFYYFSILLSNWEVSYLVLVFDLLTQPNKTLLCCTTTKSAVHFQVPNKWLAWFIWVILAMWQGSTTSPRCKEPVFTTTGQTRWVHYSRGKDGHLTLLSFKSNSVLVHYDAGGILSRRLLKQLTIQWCMAALPGSIVRAGCSWTIAAGGETQLGPWGAPLARAST